MSLALFYLVGECFRWTTRVCLDPGLTLGAPFDLPKVVDCVTLLEDKLKALEEKQGTDTVTATPSSVRNALQKPGTVYDPWEVSAHVEALVRAARSVAHEKADYYATILHELKGRSSSLSSSAHQRLLLGLLGDPTRLKVAKESSALLKAIQREEPSQFSCSSSHQLRRQSPYAPSQPLCFRCVWPGHFGRACYRGRGRGNYKR